MTIKGLAQQTQTDKRGSTYYGLKFGVNYSSIYDAKGEPFNVDPKLGLAFGGFVAFPISKLFGLQSEMLLSEKGYKATGIILGNTYAYTHTSTYLDMPLFLTVKPSNSLTLLAGGRYSYILDVTDRFDPTKYSVLQKELLQKDNTTGGSLSVGTGIDLNIKRFVLSGRANWDLTNNRLDVLGSTTPFYKNVWYQLTVGFRVL